MAEATWALVAATSSLVVIGGWYAFETHRIINRMDLEREILTRPFVGLQVIPWAPKLLKLRIQNLGAGPALDLEVHIVALTDAGNDVRDWSCPLLASGKYEEVPFPIPPGSTKSEGFNLDQIRERVSTITTSFSYKGATGKVYERQESIDIEKLTDVWAESQMLATEDHPERLGPRIAKAIDSIEKHVGALKGD